MPPAGPGKVEVMETVMWPALIERLYSKYRPLLPDAIRRSADEDLELGSRIMVFADIIRFILDSGRIDDDDRRDIGAILDGGVLRPVAPKIRELMAA